MGCSRGHEVGEGQSIIGEEARADEPQIARQSIALLVDGEGPVGAAQAARAASGATQRR